MAKNSGAWGGNPAAIPAMVTRRTTKKDTITEPDALPAQGDAPLLKYVSEPNYRRAPFNPDFDREDAKASGKVRHGR